MHHQGATLHPAYLHAHTTHDPNRHHHGTPRYVTSGLVETFAMLVSKAWTKPTQPSSHAHDQSSV